MTQKDRKRWVFCPLNIESPFKWLWTRARLQNLKLLCIAVHKVAITNCHPHLPLPVLSVSLFKPLARFVLEWYAYDDLSVGPQRYFGISWIWKISPWADMKCTERRTITKPGADNSNLIPWQARTGSNLCDYWVVVDVIDNFWFAFYNLINSVFVSREDIIAISVAIDDEADLHRV
jgi:hypothetical protein